MTIGIPHVHPAAPDPAEDLAQLLARIEAEAGPFDEHRFEDELRALARRLEAQGGSLPGELRAEAIAFALVPDYRADGGWGLYFGPYMSGLTKDGEPWTCRRSSS